MRLIETIKGMLYTFAVGVFVFNLAFTIYNPEKSLLTNSQVFGALMVYVSTDALGKFAKEANRKD